MCVDFLIIYILYRKISTNDLSTSSEFCSQFISFARVYGFCVVFRRLSSFRIRSAGSFSLFYLIVYRPDTL